MSHLFQRMGIKLFPLFSRKRLTSIAILLGLLSLTFCSQSYRTQLFHWQVAESPEKCYTPFAKSVLLPSQERIFKDQVVWLCTKVRFTGDATAPVITADWPGFKEIYWNGVLIFRGVEEAFYVEIPPGLMHRENLITVRTGRYARGIPAIVEKKELELRRGVTLGIIIATLVFLAGLALPFFFSWIRHRGALDYLFLSMYLFSGGLYGFFAFTEISYAFEYALFTVIWISLMHFIFAFVRKQLFQRWIIGVDIFALLSIPIMGIVYAYGKNQYVLLWAQAILSFVFFGVIFTYLTRLSILGVARSIRMIFVFTLSFSFVLIGSMNRIFVIFPEWKGQNLITISFVVFGGFIAILVLSRYRHAFQELEEMKKKTVDLLE